MLGSTADPMVPQDVNSGAASPPSSPAAPAFSRRGAADGRARQPGPFSRAGVPLPPGSSVPRRNSYVASEASGSSGSGTGTATAGAPGGSDSGGGGGGGRPRVTYTPVEGGGVTETVGPGRRVVSGTSVVHRTSADGRPLTTTGSVVRCALPPPKPKPCCRAVLPFRHAGQCFLFIMPGTQPLQACYKVFVSGMRP